MNQRQKANIFFNIVGVYTLVTFVWTMLAFATRGSIATPPAISAIYIAALTVYVGDKELRRLQEKYQSRVRPGEYFVYLWGMTFIAVVLFVVFGGSKNGYTVPTDLATNAGVVLLLYFVTDVLKANIVPRRKRTSSKKQ